LIRKARCTTRSRRRAHSQSELVVLSALYRNLALSRDDLGVRILELLPGTREDPIICRLVTKRLSITTRFEALSYTWGAAEPSHTIMVNGIRFSVRENLENALRHLRDKTRRRRLWVDAVCINQLDVEKRATQVMQMGQIYRNAEQVLIWLGAGNLNTDLAFRYVRWYLRADEGIFEEGARNCCPFHWTTSGEMPSDALPGLSCPKCGVLCRCTDCLLTRKLICVGLADILSRAWWQRIWVVQELAMAAADPLVGCGDSWTPWVNLVRFEETGILWPGERYPFRHLHRIRLDIKIPPRLRDLGGPVPYSNNDVAAVDIFHWLQRTAAFQATNPRDKVYALLGMARSKRWRGFRPDYTMSVHDLMFSLVSGMILVDKNLDILTLCTPSLPLEYDAPERSPRALPSWVPDFEAQGLPYIGSMGRLSEDSPLHSVMTLLSATGPNEISGSDKDMPTEQEAQATLDTCFGHPSNGLRQPGSASLKVSGFHIDKVGTLSTEHKKLLPLLDQYGQRQNAYLDLLKHDKERQIGIQDLHYKLLYFWYPVWRALDPAYLRNRHEVLGDDFIADLAAYFSDSRAVEGCKKAKVDLVSRPCACEIRTRKTPLRIASGIVRSCAQPHTRKKLAVIQGAVAYCAPV